MKNYKNLIFSVLCLVFVIPSNVYANAIVPALQFFNRFLFFPSLILLSIIIIIETIILKLCLKSINIGKHFLFAIIINITSSMQFLYLY